MAEALEIIPNGEGVLEDLKAVVYDGRLTHVMGLPEGMQSGDPSVAVLVMSKDGKAALLGQTSLRLFLEAADALRTVYGDPRVRRPVPKGQTA